MAKISLEIGEISLDKKILIINDDSSIRTILRMLLVNHGYQVEEANDGKEGIQQTLTTKPDLILLDIMMPGLDGFETCRELKKDSATQDTPVIFLSSLTSPKDKIKALESGGVDFINNVMDQGELLARVATHLKIRSLTQELILRNNELLQKQMSLKEDLCAAAMIQRSLLPSPDLKISPIDFAWSYKACNLVGGDLFNIIPLNENKIVCYMLDVCGHDIPSAMVTVSVAQSILQQTMQNSSILSPKEMLEDLNKEYPIERFNRYFTIFYLIINIKTGHTIYSSAGHPPALLLKKSKSLELLNHGGTIIGFQTPIPFEEGELILNEGDKIFLYTDGILEYQNPKGEQFGSERFYQLLEQNRNESISQIVERIERALKEFGQNNEQKDDLSIIGMDFQKIASLTSTVGAL